MFTPRGAKVGEIIPLFGPMIFELAAVKVPPPGVATTVKGVLVSHRFGTVSKLGITGLAAVTLIVLVRGQFAIVGVTTTVYMMVVTTPGGVMGQIMVEI